MPHGLLQGAACAKVFAKYEDVFIIHGDSYPAAWATQVDYVNNFLSLGYTFNDITDNCCSPFHNSQDDSVRYYGDTNNPVMISSILSKY
jgi:hypothetical protein